MNGARVIETIWQDILYALRTMRRKPVFPATAVLIVALAIGGNTAMFTIIRAVLLKPLQYRDPERLVRISGGAEPEVLKGVRVSAGFLRILGVDPMRGRAFREQEDSLGGAPGAMISAERWQRRFAGDLQILGKTAILASTPYVIIGVLPPRFEFPVPGLDVWMTAPSEWPLMPPKSRA